MKSQDVVEALQRTDPEDPRSAKRPDLHVDARSGNGVIVTGMAPDPKEVRIRQSGVGEPG